MNINERLIVALDVDKKELVTDIVDELGDSVKWYKVGLQLFTREGRDIIQFLKQRNKHVFLDLKFHDIPNTVVNAVKSAFDMEVDMLTVHSTGGFSMMEGVAKLIWQWKDHGKTPPAVVGVTLLTSLDSAFLEDIIGAAGRTVEEEVIILAKAVRSAGLSGVVASPKEILQIRENCGHDFLIITPGIRPADHEADDQVRIATPADAIRNGADYIVVGRPILLAEKRKDAAEEIIRQMKEGVNGQ